MKEKTYRRSSKWLVLVLALIMLLSGCSSGEKTTREENESKEKAGAVPADPLSLLFHEPYLNVSGIKINYQSERQKTMEKMKDVLAKEPVHAVHEVKLFSAYFAITRDEKSDYLYYGATKDNRPDGFGVLTTGPVSLDDAESLANLVYAGNFSKGLYNGYGARFNHNDFKFITVPDWVHSKGLVEDGLLAEDHLVVLCVYEACYVTCESTWKKGSISGQTNAFELTSTLNLPQEDYWGGPCYPSIIVAEAKSGALTGAAKMYANSVLMYDGNLKNGKFDGDGTRYYPDGTIQYKGKWKNNLYDGQGTLYDENGKVIYTGKWKNGDYAS